MPKTGFEQLQDAVRFSSLSPEGREVFEKIQEMARTSLAAGTAVNMIRSSCICLPDTLMSTILELVKMNDYFLKTAQDAVSLSTSIRPVFLVKPDG